MNNILLTLKKIRLVKTIVVAKIVVSFVTRDFSYTLFVGNFNEKPCFETLIENFN